MSNFFCKGWWGTLHNCHTWVYKRMGPQTLQTSLLMLPCARGCKGDLLASYPPAFYCRPIIFRFSFHVVSFCAGEGGEGMGSGAAHGGGGVEGGCFLLQLDDWTRKPASRGTLLSSPSSTPSCTFANTLHGR